MSARLKNMGRIFWESVREVTVFAVYYYLLRQREKLWHTISIIACRYLSLGLFDLHHASLHCLSWKQFAQRLQNSEWIVLIDRMLDISFLYTCDSLFLKTKQGL